MPRQTTLRIRLIIQQWLKQRLHEFQDNDVKISSKNAINTSSPWELQRNTILPIPWLVPGTSRCLGADDRSRGVSSYIGIYGEESDAESRVSTKGTPFIGCSLSPVLNEVRGLVDFSQEAFHGLSLHKDSEFHLESLA